ncbi:MAG: hypothetical protein U9R57_14600 [Thermodesulfobacteriota bacterium]|nr:hypothetical protein [Thermodesulfobacteriota bacterium]
MKLQGVACGVVYFVVLSVTALFTGCAQIPTSIGQQSNVGMISDGERVHLDDKITAEDMVDLAGRVTEKMLSSSEVQSWAKKGKKPLLVVAIPENTTHDANIITEDLQDEIISKVLDSGVSRVIDESSLSSSYNYIIKTTLTSTSQSGAGGSKVTYYTCKLQLFSLRGERLGQWNEKIGMAKAPRSIF